MPLVNPFEPAGKAAIEQARTEQCEGCGGVGSGCTCDPEVVMTARDIELMSEVEDESQPLFDSTLDTIKHSRRVDELLVLMTMEIQARIGTHDESKLHDPEKAIFDEMTPLLQTTTYGSDEYKAHLEQMKVALDHHYAENRHHPEHFPNGVAGMTLVDVVEMLVDWKAATERHADGSLATSLPIQKERFGISDDLAQILENTAEWMDWL